jgi:hypothetical protein
MRLDLRFSTRPLEDLWCQAVALLVLQERDFTEGPLFGLNIKMGGFLAHLETKGLWAGSQDERLLVASQNMIRSDKLLFHGLGGRSSCNISVLEQGIRDLGAALDKMRINDFGLAIPVMGDSAMDYLYQIEKSLPHLLNPFYEHHGNDMDFILKVIVSVDKEFIKLLYPVTDRLRQYFASLLDVSVIIDRKINEELKVSIA